MTGMPSGRPSEPRTGPAAPAPAHGDGPTRPSPPTGRTEPRGCPFGFRHYNCDCEPLEATMPEPADHPPLRDQIASAIGGTMILRTSVDEITEAVMQVVHPHLKPQAEAARRMDDPGPLRDQIADRLGQTIAQWWQTPPRLDLAADAVLPVVEDAIAPYRMQVDDPDSLLTALDQAERERDQARDAIADERRGRLAAEAAVRRALPAIESAHTALVTSPRDQAAARDTAWLYGIFVGWDPETPDGTDGAMDELAAQYRWRPEDVERLRELHSAVRDLRAALDAEQPKETP